jgi:dienelactone hydrolase
MEFAKVGYSDGALGLTGFHARPSSPPRAAVAIYPTFMNSTPAVEAKARQLVDSGFAVLIADYYGPEAPSTIDEAFTAMRMLRGNPQAMRQRLRPSLDLLRKLEPSAPHLAIGFCLGGMAVLEMARDGQDLVAVCSFHGLLDTALPAKEAIRPRILICHGDADSMVPRDRVVAFWEEMDAVKADWHFHSYAGVEHGFTNPHTLDGALNPAYNASADRQSWAAMLSLFDEVLD